MKNLKVNEKKLDVNYVINKRAFIKDEEIRLNELQQKIEEELAKNTKLEILTFLLEAGLISGTIALFLTNAIALGFIGTALSVINAFLHNEVILPAALKSESDKLALLEDKEYLKRLKNALETYIKTKDSFYVYLAENQYKQKELRYL